MKRKMNRILLIASFLMISLVFSWSIPDILNAPTPDIYAHLAKVLDLETGSANLVTGIYLDYRLYDTLFEATILFVAVTGVLFMSKKDDRLR